MGREVGRLLERRCHPVRFCASWNDILEEDDVGRRAFLTSSEGVGFYEANKVVPLAAFTPERIPVFKDTPTMSELGHDGMVYFMQRSVVMAPGVPADVQKYYVDVFEKVYKSKEWQDYCHKKALQCAWLTGQPLQDYFLAERDKHREMLKEAGEIK